MKTIILETIKEIQEEKRNNNRSPDHCLDTELLKRLRGKINNTLHYLIATKKITGGNTINNKYYKINE